MEVMIDGVKYVPAEEPATGNILLSALEVRFDSDAGEQITMRGHLHELLSTMWDQGEGFSGKRPFGNSGWEAEIFQPLIKAGYIKGELDEYGAINSIADEDQANIFVFDMIRAAFFGVKDANY